MSDRYFYIGIDRPMYDQEIFNPLTLPGVDCPNCSSWGGHQFVMDTRPFETEAVRLDKRLEGVLPLAEFRDFSKAWETQFGYLVRPADRFPPAVWVLHRAGRLTDYKDIPFLHSVWHVLFRSDLSELVLNVCPGDITVSAIRVVDGNKEFERLMDYWAVSKAYDQHVDVHFTYNTNDAWRKDYASSVAVCELCGREKFSEPPEAEERRSHFRRSGVIPPRYVPDADIFATNFFKPPLGFVVSSRLWEQISPCCSKTYQIRELTIE